MVKLNLPKDYRDRFMLSSLVKKLKNTFNNTLSNICLGVSMVSLVVLPIYLAICLVSEKMMVTLGGILIILAGMILSFVFLFTNMVKNPVVSISLKGKTITFNYSLYDIKFCYTGTKFICNLPGFNRKAIVFAKVIEELSNKPVEVNIINKQK